ncbi:hypothetical protein EB75_02455 [Mycobacterium sp. ST-F2]|uniref:hypothetical protein n=1 Tax=Mycobacterium sp. ST-F2 TaxID=1490484 RepID=UPI00093C282E|nr:hypothetical protein [Mycobacterium sp. ST-F2]OKH76530.1 hypothetical protein EB75_02455 [Mycobacterium sp. ST-F2]
MGPKSRGEAFLLSGVTVVAFALMVLQLAHNDWSVDLWVVVSFGLGALPWFWRVLESIEFPGGGGLKLRQLEGAVERQQSELDAMRFVVAHFLPDAEQRVLGRFASSEPFTLDLHSDEFFNASGTLRGLGFIEPIRDNWHEGFNEHKDLKTLFRLTDSGREYLVLRSQSQEPTA